jgi:hypothetical protein
MSYSPYWADPKACLRFLERSSPIPTPIRRSWWVADPLFSEVHSRQSKAAEEYYTKRRLSTWSIQRGWSTLCLVRVGGFSRMKNRVVRRYGPGDRLNKSSAPFAIPAKSAAPMIGSARREAWWCVRCSSRLPLGSQKRNRVKRLSHPPNK